MSRLMLIDRAEVPDVDAAASQREALDRASDLLGIELLAARQSHGFGEPFGRLELWATSGQGEVLRVACHAGRVLDRHFDRMLAVALRARREPHGARRTATKSSASCFAQPAANQTLTNVDASRLRSRRRPDSQRGNAGCRHLGPSRSRLGRLCGVAENSRHPTTAEGRPHERYAHGRRDAPRLR